MTLHIFSRGWSEGFDGPGRRLVFYLKGCNLRCLWCGNPESIASQPQMLFRPQKNPHAHLSCPAGAVRNGEIDRSVCACCDSRECVRRWRDKAFEWCGEKITVKQLLQIVTERSSLFGTDGGVTFSGGEPTLQMEPLLQSAQALRNSGVHVALETNATSPHLATVAENFNLIIADLKCVTPQLHRQITGVDNETILRNLSCGIVNVIRIPLIDRVNFTEAERHSMRIFLMRTRTSHVELLRLHHMGMAKYAALGEPYPAADWSAPSQEQAESYAKELRAAGVNAILAN